MDALGVVAAQLAERRQLLGRLHPFGHGVEPERVGQVDDGSDDGGVVGVAAEAGDGFYRC